MMIFDEKPITPLPTSLARLEEIVMEIGQSPWLWGHAVEFDRERHAHRVLHKTGALEVALFGWATGQETRFHDHGGASGAAFICCGTLIEDVVEALDGLVIGERTHMRRAGSAFSFGPDYIHRVRHDPAHGLALSIHAYTPAVRDALDFDVRPDRTLRAREPVPELV